MMWQKSRDTGEGGGALVGWLCLVRVEILKWLCLSADWLYLCVRVGLTLSSMR